MKIVVTCGPSIEPIDQVRCITNFSTGELGLLLANALTASGHEVICLKGTRSTCPLPLHGATLRTFATNENLLAELRALAGLHIDAVFHTAALGDFKVASIRSGDEIFADAAKISSRSGALELRLEPAPKLIAALRPLFPTALLVGWKYELEGNRESALSRARQQWEKNGTDACVLNGAAYGSGFAFCQPEVGLVAFEDKPALCTFIVDWLAAKGRQESH